MKKKSVLSLNNYLATIPINFGYKCKKLVNISLFLQNKILFISKIKIILQLDSYKSNPMEINYKKTTGIINVSCHVNLKPLQLKINSPVKILWTWK
jgi:hypothetical protein